MDRSIVSGLIVSALAIPLVVGVFEIGRGLHDLIDDDDENKFTRACIEYRRHHPALARASDFGPLLRSACMREWEEGHRMWEERYESAQMTSNDKWLAEHRDQGDAE